jgi:predicted subunit of tRNA(5-methylaminomethyl-2-thiouridylate) methyltransferase
MYLNRLMKCLVMLSGGLDSVIAAHLLKSQGLEVEALHFVLPFDAGLGKAFAAVRRSAESADVPLTIIEEGEEYLTVMKDPAFGYGKHHANPCIDCRIHRLSKARLVMAERGAAFIATGEVVGQRPMSQKLHIMNAIEKRAGLKGLLLRPLSAQILKPTTAETSGWVDRSRLLGISGRGRAAQLAYARLHGLVHGSPGGGCILTNEMTARRFADLQGHIPDFSLQDLRLIAWGRRFRLSDDTVFAVGRDDAENEVLAKLAVPGDWSLRLVDFGGPLGLIRGRPTEDERSLCAGMIVRYATKARESGRANVLLTHDGVEETLDASPVGEDVCDRLRV